MRRESPHVDPIELDRLRELANIGAGHAADALAQLAGRNVWMEVPRVRDLTPADTAEGEVAPLPETNSAGVFFELAGCIDALVVILFRPSERETVVRQMLGGWLGPLSAESVESVLKELGNILASQVASAIADTLGDRLLPSLPRLTLEHAESELSRLLQQRAHPHPFCIDCRLTDGRGEIGGLIVVVPDTHPAQGA